MLTPHRPLGPTGFLIFMLVLGGISVVSGMVFLMAGAWPIFGFFGLDVLLVYWAFRINYRAARAYEEVTVTASELTLRKVSYHGRGQRMDPQSVGCGSIATSMRSSASSGSIWRRAAGGCRSASFLGPDEKASFAQPSRPRSGKPSAGPTRTVFG